jgi:hypothetical protein
MIVDVRRCGDATPEDDICVGGAKGQGRRKRHLEAVIKMLDPGLRAISVKRRQANPWFKRGIILPPRRRRAQDGHRAIDGAGDSRRVLTAATSPIPTRMGWRTLLGASWRP